MPSAWMLHAWTKIGLFNQVRDNTSGLGFMEHALFSRGFYVMSSSWEGLLAIHQALTPLHARPHLSGCRRQRPLMKCGKHNSVLCTKSGNRIILGTSIKTRLWLIVSVCKCSDHRSIKIPALLETQSPLILTSRPFDTITASQHHGIHIP
jgi:hypothetical protein